MEQQASPEQQLDPPEQQLDQLQGLLASVYAKARGARSNRTHCLTLAR